MRSRRVYAAGYIFYMQLATPVFHATWISRVSHAAAFSLRRCRSADYQIAPDKRVPPRRVYIRGTFVLSRNGIIVHTVGTRYFDYAECTLSRPPVHACNSNLIVAAELSHSRKKNWFSASTIESSLLTLIVTCKKCMERMILRDLKFFWIQIWK